MKSGETFGWRWLGNVEVTTAPLKVTNLTIGQPENGNNSLVSVKWNVERESNQTSFEINVNGNEPRRISNTSFSTEIYARTGVKPNIEVVALSGNVRSETVFDNTYLVPLAKVTGLKLTKTGNGSLSVSWDDIDKEENNYDGFQLK